MLLLVDEYFSPNVNLTAGCGNRRKPNDSEVGENGGGGGEGSSRQEGAGGRRDKKRPGQGRKDKQGGVERMETSDDTPPASKPSGKDDNAGEDGQ